MIKNLLLTISFLMAFGVFAQAQNEYIGVAKCKMCHNKTTTGKQYDVWVKGPHAKSMESLKSEKALEYAKANNIADPSKEAKCLKCHSTYHGADEDLMATITEKEGVSCESCHGAGSAYKSTSVMKNKDNAIAKGLVMPTKEVCVTCHNDQNPFHKPFDFETYSKKIAHPNPAAH